MSLFASATFCFGNKHTFTFHSDGPVPFCLKQLTTTIPQIPADVDLSGQIVLITGANSGVGFQSAKLYAKHKARVIFGVRNVRKGETAARKIRDEFESAEIKVMKIDMESFEMIRAFVEELEKTEPRVDIAVLNAGICQYETSRSSTGYDIHLQVRLLVAGFYIYRESLTIDSLSRSDEHPRISIPRPPPYSHSPPDQKREGETCPFIVHHLRSPCLLQLHQKGPS